ncbi:CU044_5270 family protein [Streptomyces sp. NPDC006012]|uniref:CU044_5270 family protein n=1 Tax=Streptomyces sp. NPDC006012 TaxID=3364739 RepID=UPI0036B7BF25
MADELDLLRRANPVPADDPLTGDGPLAPHAERALNRLLHAPHPGHHRYTRLAWGLAACAVVLVTALAVLLGGTGTTPAVAAPRPLTVRPHSTVVPLDRLAALAAAAAEADGSPELRKGTHVQSWSLGMSDDRPPVTLPEERIVRWHSDDSRTEIVVATDPRHPGRPVLTDEDGSPHQVADGHVLSRRTYPPSWSDAPPQAPPPHGLGQLRAYLAETIHTDSLTMPRLLDAVDELLDHWTLGARESAALVRLLADTPGLRPVGQVTDRLGRPGQAYVHDTAGTRRMLVLDPATGAVRGTETTFSADQPEYGVVAGDVMEYSAWMR